MKNDDNKFNKGAKDVFKSHLNSITFEFLHFFQISLTYIRWKEKKKKLFHESFGYLIKVRICKYFGLIMKTFYKVCKRTETNYSLLQFSLCSGSFH